MTEYRGILIRNIYHMLAYSFRVLKQNNYDDIASEEFEHIEDLFAAILAKGVAQQLKQGLRREYVQHCEDMPVMRGKLHMQGTIRNKLMRKQRLTCEFDELSENNTHNQILKTTAIFLLHHSRVKPKHKNELKRVLRFFGEIETREPFFIPWGVIRHQRCDQNYRMLMNICYFVLEGLLLSTEKGSHRMAVFLDDQKIYKLFESFVREYFKEHYPEMHAGASHVKWNLDDSVSDLLPAMRTDTTLEHGRKTLIIDTKFYSRTMQTDSRYDSQTLHSNNLYQIYTYVKNKDRNHTGDVSGLLLYAKTSSGKALHNRYMMDGNAIYVRTIDLNNPFFLIEEQLSAVAELLF